MTQPNAPPAASPADADAAIVRRQLGSYQQVYETIKSQGDPGKLGHWLGSIEYHTGYIALGTIAGLLVISLILALGLIFNSSTTSEDLKTVMLSSLGLTGTIVGYLFGRQHPGDAKPEKPPTRRLRVK